jgi:two-component system, OmpR family, copper resistance phosphate regulon response regulator CusR
MWVLVIEDEARLADLLRRGLESEGFTVDTAYDGANGEDLARVNAYDVVIVDWRLPKRDGRTVVESLRSDGISMPIIMLTALDDVEHRVAGLNAGADDYLAKPFSFEELLARIRAITRRPPLAGQDNAITLGPLLMNIERRTVSVSGVEIVLRPKEYTLLEVLLRNPEAVLSRSIIAERVWGSVMYVSDNVIDVTVSGLRQKLRDAAGDLVALETVRGVGYRIRARDE